MAEKLFVIAELKMISAEGDANYTLADGRGYLHLPDDAVIPSSRLRYQLPCPGEIFFHVRDGWKRCTGPGWDSYQVLILDPPEPVDEFEKWVEEMPYRPDLDFPNQKMKAWFRRMPARK